MRKNSEVMCTAEEEGNILLEIVQRSIKSSGYDGDYAVKLPCMM